MNDSESSEEPSEETFEGDDSPSETVVEVDAALEQIIPTFFSELEQDIEQLRTHLDQGETDPVEDIAHDLKGSGGGYGFDRITELGRAIEDAARENRLDDASRRVDKLEAYLDAVTVEYVD